MAADRAGALRAQLILLTALTGLPVAAVSVSDVKLYEQTHFSRVELNSFRGKDLVLSFFQPDARLAANNCGVAVP